MKLKFHSKLEFWKNLSQTIRLWCPSQVTFASKSWALPSAAGLGEEAVTDVFPCCFGSSCWALCDL